jgi:WD repeat and SOF domain-containing protein 1
VAQHQQSTRASTLDIHRLPKNPDPILHPFEREREYTRALNAVKLNRIFAKPFIASLEGHRDGVYCMAKNKRMLTQIVSGSGDGEVRVWDLATKKTSWRTQAHKGIVRGVCFNPSESQVVSCANDKTIKIWSVGRDEPVAVFKGKHFYSGVDHHREKPVFATSGGSVIEVWDQQRSEPIHSWGWGADTINTVRFNQTHTSVLASCGTDRTVILYDLRQQSPLSKLVMNMKSNAICWNPMEAFNFAVANEDQNVYLFDMRRMKQSLNVLKDHVSAVLDVDYSPTGEELVTASYDKSLRIFPVQSGHSREIYHTSRMQHLFCTLYSMDSRYVMSGSDDGNIRLWKANASEKLGPMAPREQVKKKYSEALIKRYEAMPEIKRINRHRHVPKPIKSAASLKRTILDNERKREENRRKHSKPGTVGFKAERKKSVLAVEK